MRPLALLILGLLGAAAVCGFGAMVSFLKAGVWPDRQTRAEPPRSHAGRLGLILGLDLDEVSHGHWRRAWTLTSLFLLFWFLAFLAGALLLPFWRSA